MTRRVLLPSLVLSVLAAASCVRPTPTPTSPLEPRFELRGEFIAAKPPANVTRLERFGGISGLAALTADELLGVSDDHTMPRIYRLRVTWTGGAFSVEKIGVIPLQTGGGAPPTLDTEGIAVARDGRIFVASEGMGTEEPRLPPALVEYAPDGRFVRQLAVRSRYTPTQRGPLVVGVRENAAFESLTLSPDERQLFTASELPLAQDGVPDAFTPGARSRILEYVASDGTYVPGREFVYEISPVEPQPFLSRFAVNGLVELISLGNGELLALERAFVESIDRTKSANRIRVYRVSLADATDVSSFDALPADGSAIRPVKKTLLLDVNKARGLSSRLATLDNFEGMALGPPGPSGTRPLLLVSDDNFSARQVTGFLLFGTH